MELRLGLGGTDRLSASLTTTGLNLPGPLAALKGASVVCPQAEATASGITCARAELRLTDDQGASEALALVLRLDRKAGHWQLHARAEALAPARLWAFAARHDWVPPLDIGAGALDFELDLGRAPPQGDRLRLVAWLRGLSFSDADGLNAGENLDARLALRLSRAGSEWRARADAVVDAGEIYLDPVFVDAGTHPLTLAGQGVVDAETGRLIVEHMHVRHDTVAAADGGLTLAADGSIESFDLRLPRTPLSPVYRSYLQPFTVGSALDALNVDGAASARITWRPPPEGWRVRLDMTHTDISDTSGRFGVSGVEGRIEWNEWGEPQTSRIAWQGGRVYRVALGAGAISGRLSGRRFRLQEALDVPLLGGGLEVDALEVDGIGAPGLGWRFRGRVRALSLASLTKALGWPAFGGTLAGDIPLVHYSDGLMSVDGGLDVEVFGGHVRIDDLTVRDAFGVIPELRADVRLENLSLDALTGAFSFGNIQGRLQGWIHGLTLKDWRPTAFDARFATPDDDDSRHRISQRAVSNLASLGGAGAVLSSTFFRIFDEFSYRRLGIACRLQNGVCEMDGIAPAEQGYYIVEGGGLPPRIDVLGFNRRVDWDVLLGRLRQIVASEGPVIH